MKLFNAFDQIIDMLIEFPITALDMVQQLIDIILNLVETLINLPTSILNQIISMQNQGNELMNKSFNLPFTDLFFQ